MSERTVAMAEAFGDPDDHGTIPNEPSAVRKMMRRLRGPDVRLEVAYEAGPTCSARWRLTRGLARLRHQGSVTEQPRLASAALRSPRTLERGERPRPDLHEDFGSVVDAGLQA